MDLCAVRTIGCLWETWARCGPARPSMARQNPPRENAAKCSPIYGRVRKPRGNAHSCDWRTEQESASGPITRISGESSPVVVGRKLLLQYRRESGSASACDVGSSVPCHRKSLRTFLQLASIDCIVLSVRHISQQLRISDAWRPPERRLGNGFRPTHKRRLWTLRTGDQPAQPEISAPSAQAFDPTKKRHTRSQHARTDVPVYLCVS